MAPKGDLVKVGREGFDMVEEYLGGKRRKVQPWPPHTTSCSPVQAAAGKGCIAGKREATIDCNQAAKLYGGLLFVGYRQKPSPSPRGLFY